MSKYDYLVVGAGFTGSVFSRQKAEQGFKVKMIDKRPHIGGNAFDYEHETGVTIHKYGPHLFHTNSSRVYDWLSQFTKWNPYEHRVIASLGAEKPTVPVPFNFRSIDLCFESWQSRAFKEALCEMRQHNNQRFTLGKLMKSSDHHIVGLAMYVYENIFKHYTKKMWDMTLEELGPTVADRVPIIAGYDDRYFADDYQALPADGYTNLFKKMLDHPNITVETGVEYEHDMEGEAKLFFTGPIDEYFGSAEGSLPYRGIEFVVCPDTEVKLLKGAATLNFTSMETSYTRVTSMRALNGLQSNSRDISVYEQPNYTERYYPYSTEAARSLYRKYEDAATAYPKIKFAGRLGSYQYLNMDQAVAQALKCAEEF